MSLLSNKELESIRSDIAEMLPDTGYIIGITRTADGQGGYSESTAIVTGGTVSCRLDARINNALRSGESVAGDAIQPFHQFILTLPHDAPITTDNQFLLGTVLYNVISVDPNKSWNAAIRAIVERT